MQSNENHVGDPVGDSLFYSSTLASRGQVLQKVAKNGYGTNKSKISQEKCRKKEFRRKEKNRILFLGLTCFEKNFIPCSCTLLTPLLSTLPLVRVFSFSVCHPIDSISRDRSSGPCSPHEGWDFTERRGRGATISRRDQGS